jgi:hypothetical protein
MWETGLWPFKDPELSHQDHPATHIIIVDCNVMN